MNIKHIPDGLFPHNKCEFNREPVYPTEGEHLSWLDCDVELKK
ncbi:hypothetical protein [Clostridium sp. HCS.1]